jgi:hypothetical protein
MNLALIVLKVGTVLISATEELELEPRAHLFKPYEVTGKTKATLSSWPPFTDDDHILLHSDDILTVCAPKEQITKQYLTKSGFTMDDFALPEVEEPIPELLTEEDNILSPIDSGTLDEDDGYEPRYVESDNY